MKNYEIQLDTEVTKKSPHKHKVKKTQPPIDLSFEPLGALKIDSLLHGEIEINPDKIDDVLLSVATGTLSMIPDFYQYVPSLPSFYGEEEPAERSSEDRSSAPRKHHRTHPSHHDESEKDDNSKESSEPKDDQSGPESRNNSDEKSDHERPEDDDDNAAEEHDDDSKQTPADSKPENNSEDETNKNEPKSEQEPSSKETSKEDKNSKESSKEKVPELVPEIEVPIEELPKEGYVDKFVKYYSYAKPLAKAASLFVPGIGQYRGVMLGVEMADLAYNVASMYSNGDGYLSMGYFLGKEAFKRLGRRNEPGPESLPISQNSDTKVTSNDLDNFLEKVKSTQYPSLDENKEQEIKTSVSKIIYKYCYDQEQYQNESERAKFIDFMISCVKFIALHEILPAVSSNKST